MKKYVVTFACTGYATIEAENAIEVINKSKLLKREDINWEDGFEDTDMQKVTYTVHKYGKTVDDILDVSYFDDADTAIEYAKQNDCSEVVNDITGEVVYEKEEN